jgi:hypothetical protein
MAYDRTTQRRVVRAAGREFVKLGGVAERTPPEKRLQLIAEGLAALGLRVAGAGVGANTALNDSVAAGCRKLAAAACGVSATSPARGRRRAGAPRPSG